MTDDSNYRIYSKEKWNVKVKKDLTIEEVISNANSISHIEASFSDEPVNLFVKEVLVSDDVYFVTSGDDEIV